MNLVIDFGNTRIKAAFFDGNEMLRQSVFKNVSEFKSSGWLNGDFESCLISSVTQHHLPLLASLQAKTRLFVFDSQTPIPLKNLYKTPKTLGSDRILSSIASFTFFPKQNVLTVDAGTCIKYNFVNENNEFLGGAISPGIAMRLKAMHNFTSGLPLVEMDEKFDQWLGDDTGSSLLSGAQFGAICEAEGLIHCYNKNYNNLKVVLTGGDSHYLSKQLKNPFFANHNHLLLGLNTVLLYNLEK